MRIKPNTVLKLMSYWPPFLAAGISIKEYNLDQGFITSQLKAYPTNKNYFGTHFGGSLYSMCDPFYVFILAHHLGKDFIIWDVQASIKFKKAVSEPVQAKFSISPEEATQIKHEALAGEIVLPEFHTSVKTLGGEVVAEVFKKLYVKKKT